VACIEVSLAPLLENRVSRQTARPVSRFPSGDFDLAFVVDDAIAADEVLATLVSAAGDLLEHAWLFDVYRGVGVAAGSRSLAFRLRLVAQDRTLSDADLAAARERCVSAVVSTHGAVLRG
jgi:phenylalanyl-tRNA synthetase beta chain